MGKLFQVVVHGAKGEKLIIDLCNTDEQMKSMTVLQLKEKIAEALPGIKGTLNAFFGVHFPFLSFFQRTMFHTACKTRWNCAVLNLNISLMYNYNVNK